MSKRKADEPVFDEENPEWTDADFARARGPDSLPPEVLAAFPRTRKRGPQKAATKRAVSLRLSRDVVDHFKATGPGWQTRIDDTLKQAISRKLV